MDVFPHFNVHLHISFLPNKSMCWNWVTHGIRALYLTIPHKQNDAKIQKNWKQTFLFQLPREIRAILHTCTGTHFSTIPNITYMFKHWPQIYIYIYMDVFAISS